MKKAVITPSRFKAILAATAYLGLSSAFAGTPPQTGDTAPDFALQTIENKTVELKQLTVQQPVVLVVLRGWPGYQCPLCTRQVHDFVSHASEFAGKAQVLMVYPGPADQLKEHAQEFLQDKQWPKEFLFVMDPDYTFTKAYGLRWEAKNETAYPSTFLVDKQGKVRFARVSKEHGGRVSASDALKALQAIK